MNTVTSKALANGEDTGGTTKALVKMPGDAPWRSAELADHFVQFLDMVKVKAGGVEALTASADTFAKKERQLSQIAEDDEEEENEEDTQKKYKSDNKVVWPGII